MHSKQVGYVEVSPLSSTAAFCEEQHSTAAAGTRTGKERWPREDAADTARARCPPPLPLLERSDRSQPGHRAALFWPQRPADRLCASAGHHAHTVSTMHQVVKGAADAPAAVASRRRLATTAGRAQQDHRAHVMHRRVTAATPSASARPARSAQLLTWRPTAPPSSTSRICCGRKHGHVAAHASAPGGRTGTMDGARTTWSQELQMTRG